LLSFCGPGTKPVSVSLILKPETRIGFWFDSASPGILVYGKNKKGRSEQASKRPKVAQRRFLMKRILATLLIVCGVI
jgi:hypothetical protein